MVYALLILVLILVGLQLSLKTNTAVVFFAICSGRVFLDAAGQDVGLIAHSVASSVNFSSNFIYIFVVLLPALITAIVLKNRVAKSKLILTVVPAVCAAIVALTLVYPLLSTEFQKNLANSQGWELVDQYYQFIVVLGIFSSVFTLMATIPKSHNSGHHKKAKH